MKSVPGVVATGTASEVADQIDREITRVATAPGSNLIG